MAKRKKYKISNRKILKSIIIISIIVVIVIIVNIMRIQNILNNKDGTGGKAQLSSGTSNFETILKKYGIVINSIEILEDEIIYVDLKFKYNLYEDGKSKKDYFESLIKELNLYASKNYTLHDEIKEIEIIVKKDLRTNKFTYTINGEEEFFKNEYMMELEKHEIIKEKEMVLTNASIKILEGFEWNLINEKSFKPIGNGIFINEDNLKVEASNLAVTRVIIDKEYKKNIIGNINIETEINEIKNQLGEPTFLEDRLNMIGYKLKDTYVFFYEDEVILYPNVDYNNNSFERLIFSYYENKDKMDRARVANEILNQYPDFISYIEGDYLILKSISRQIELKISKDNLIEITIYNNYNYGERMKNYVREGKIILNLSEDYICKTEIEKSKNN